MPSFAHGKYLLPGANYLATDFSARNPRMNGIRKNK